jgi:hypothetical protein
MPETTSRRRLDEHVLVAGTTVRFVQLLVLIAATSAGMVTSFLGGIDNDGGIGCFLAAGGDPLNLQSTDINRLVVRMDAFDRCTAEHDPPPPWWLGAAWISATALTAFGLFHLYPVWLVARRRLEPLTPLRHAEEIEVLEGLAKRAGLRRLPRIVVDRDPLAENPFVFGRDGRPVVLVPEGMLKHWRDSRKRSQDSALLTTVMLHEFAHIRNRDVTVTYATVTLWWAFAVTTLLPFLVWRVQVLVEELQQPAGRPHVVLAARDIVFAVVLSLVIYLVRVEVLRNRELYADLTAHRHKADLSMLDGRREPGDGAWARVRAALRRVLDHHPTPAERWNVLGDNKTLFAARPLPLLLTGVAAVLIGDQLAAALPLVVPPDLAVQIVSLTQAGLIAAVVGIALWRAVVYAAATATRRPSGIAAGMWLGVGLVVGELARGRINGFQWTSAHPEMLALVLAAGVVFGWWTARCVALWLSVWRSRSILPVALLVLVGGALALSAWFTWWQYDGISYADGGNRFDTEVVLAVLKEGLVEGDAPLMLELFAATLAPLNGFGHRPLVWVALAIVWIVPLAAWLLRRTTGEPLWLERRSDYAATQPPPPLRRVLTAALIGTVCCCVTIASVQAYLHFTYDPSDQALVAILHLAWSTLALVVGGVAAAAAASVLVDRYRILAALIAVSLAGFAGLAGVFGLFKLDGCVDAISPFDGECGQMPFSIAWEHISLLVPHTFVAAAAAAILAAALVSMFARMPRRARPAQSRTRQFQVARRFTAAALCIVAAGTAVTGEVATAQSGSPGEDGSMAELLRTQSVQATPYVQRMQITSWAEYGGDALLDRLDAAFQGITAALTGEVRDQALLRTHCEAATATATDARDYFAIPDAEAQAYWDMALDRIESVGPICVIALDTHNDALFARALTEILAVTEAMSAVFARMQVLLAERNA